MNKVRIVLVGGFLGSGKTTSILRLAQMLKQKGLKPCIVTNDQGAELVDSQFVKTKGFEGSEVTGGCFCCKYDDFSSSIHMLIDANKPDVILAEPVGSCTDLMKTVLFPLLKYYPGKISAAPYSVIIDSVQLKEIVQGSTQLSEDMVYLYKKQIEEANILLLNKTDLISERDKCQLKSYLESLCPGTFIMDVSAKSGMGFDFLLEQLLDGSCRLNPLKEIDYLRYGNAEASLGWSNYSFRLAKDVVFDPNDFMDSFLDRLQKKLNSLHAVITHLKVFAEGDGGSIKASLVQPDCSAAYSLRAYDLVKELYVILNARVGLEPTKLAEAVEEALEQVADEWRIYCYIDHKECFKPAFPQPVHR